MRQLRNLFCFCLCPCLSFCHCNCICRYVSVQVYVSATVISSAATYSCSSTAAHFNEMLYIVRYLKDSSFRGLTLHPGLKGQPLQLTCYVDASYLTHKDSKSQTGYCLSFGNLGSFYSKSSKQSLVATSSTHAEIRALQALTLDILFIIHLCNELQRPLTLPCIFLKTISHCSTSLRNSPNIPVLC